MRNQDSGKTFALAVVPSRRRAEFFVHFS
jgi:hypothetical protein